MSAFDLDRLRDEWRLDREAVITRFGYAPYDVARIVFEDERQIRVEILPGADLKIADPLYTTLAHEVNKMITCRWNTVELAFGDGPPGSVLRYYRAQLGI